MIVELAPDLRLFFDISGNCVVPGLADQHVRMVHPPPPVPSPAGYFGRPPPRPPHIGPQLTASNFRPRVCAPPAPTINTRVPPPSLPQARPQQQPQARPPVLMQRPNPPAQAHTRFGCPIGLVPNYSTIVPNSGQMNLCKS
jgi:hypothetical protein